MSAVFELSSKVLSVTALWWLVALLDTPSGYLSNTKIKSDFKSLFQVALTC